MPTVANACARSSSRPSSSAIAGLDRRARGYFQLGVDLADTRREGEHAGGPGETESPTSSAARSRCSSTSCAVASIPVDARQESLRLGGAVACHLRRATRRAPSRAPPPGARHRPRGARVRSGREGLAARRPPARARALPRSSDAAAGKLLSANARSPASRSARRVRSVRTSSSPPDARTSSSAELQWYASISAWSSERPSDSIHSATRRCFDARSARGDLAVRDIADERVRERELGGALERRAALPADEALALERVQKRSVTSSPTSAPVQNTLPITDASWRRLFSCSGDRRAAPR